MLKLLQINLYYDGTDDDTHCKHRVGGHIILGFKVSVIDSLWWSSQSLSVLFKLTISRCSLGSTDNLPYLPVRVIYHYSSTKENIILNSELLQQKRALQNTHEEQFHAS